MKLGILKEIASASSKTYTALGPGPGPGSWVRVLGPGSLFSGMLL